MQIKKKKFTMKSVLRGGGGVGVNGLSSPTSRRNILSPSSVWNTCQPTRNKLAASIVRSEDVGNTFLQNVGELLPDYTTLNFGKQYSSYNRKQNGETEFAKQGQTFSRTNRIVYKGFGNLMSRNVYYKLYKMLVRQL
jgi:hypothetical protein